MTIAMVGLHRLLPKCERHPLPPEDITQELVVRVSGQKPGSRAEHQMVAWSGHFCFGAGAGLVYGTLAERVEAPPVFKGALFGLLVWATSYLGWLPQTQILDQPGEQSARSNGLMIVAHVVWGVCLGILNDRNLSQ